MNLRNATRLGIACLASASAGVLLMWSLSGGAAQRSDFQRFKVGYETEIIKQQEQFMTGKLPISGETYTLGMLKDNEHDALQGKPYLEEALFKGKKLSGTDEVENKALREYLQLCEKATFVDSETGVEIFDTAEFRKLQREWEDENPDSAQYVREYNEARATGPVDILRVEAMNRAALAGYFDESSPIGHRFEYKVSSLSESDTLQVASEVARKRAADRQKYWLGGMSFKDAAYEVLSDRYSPEEIEDVINSRSPKFKNPLRSEYEDANADIMVWFDNNMDWDTIVEVYRLMGKPIN